MGSDGRLWAALAKVLSQKKEHPGRTALADSAGELDEDDVVLENGQAQRRTARAH